MITYSLYFKVQPPYFRMRLLFGNRVFKEVMKVRWSPQGGPWCDLSVKCPHRLVYLSPWAPAGGSVLTGCGIFKRRGFVEGSRSLWGGPWGFLAWPHFPLMFCSLNVETCDHNPQGWQGNGPQEMKNSWFCWHWVETSRIWPRDLFLTHFNTAKTFGKRFPRDSYHKKL